MLKQTTQNEEHLLLTTGALREVLISRYGRTLWWTLTIMRFATGCRWLHVK